MELRVPSRSVVADLGASTISDFGDGAILVPVPRARPRAVLLRDALNRRLLAAADVLALGIALTVTTTVVGHGQLRPASLAAIPIVVLVGKLNGVYGRDELRVRKTTLEEAPTLFHTAALYALVLWLLEDVLVRGGISQAQAVAFWMSLVGLGLVFRAMSRRVAQRIGPSERCLLIGSRAAATNLASKLERAGKVTLVGQVELLRRGNGHGNGNGNGHGKEARFANGGQHDARVEGNGGWTTEELRELIESVDAHRVIVAPEGVGGDEVLDVIGAVKECGASVSVLPRLFDVVGSSVEFDRIEGLTLLGVQRFGLSRSSRVVKRALDLIGSVTGLLLLSPLFAALALAVKLDSKGPVLFRQTRVGREGERFEMLKFRTMVDGAEQLRVELEGLNEAAEGLFKIAEDPRLTRVGARLRRMSLDELPQLWNVLRAEMSLVGPRPLVVYEDERVVGRHRRRLQLKPGMTGQWQVLGSSQIPLAEMLTIDYLYAANWSLWDDVKILIRTVLHVLGRRGV